jgi:F5/8 type C domain
MDWQAASCAYGVDGWFHWHWRGQNDPEVWTGTDDGGIINTVLAPSQRPDPCVRKAFPGIETNLVLGRPTTVSSAQADAPGSNAVDGTTGTAWISGADPPGWIEVQLAQPSTVREIRLAIAQFPNGQTVHRLLVRTSAGLQEVRRFEGSTADGDTLTWQPPAPLVGVLAVRVETDSSPSFVAWKELEVLG